MKICFAILLCVSFNSLFSMERPFKAPLFGNNLDLENPDNLKRALELARQLEFYDVLSWQAKEVCDDCTQQAYQDSNLKKPRATSFLAYRETRCAYAQAFLTGEPRALALFKCIEEKVAVKRSVHPDLFIPTKMEICCKRDEYKFCDAHLDEYKTQAALRICKEVELLPMTYEQMAGYLPTAKMPLAQKMFDEIHLILRIKNPFRVPLQVGDDLVWLEKPKQAYLGALEARELHDKNAGLDLCDEFTALVLWANRASGKNIEEMSNQELMENFLRIITGEKVDELSKKT